MATGIGLPGLRKRNGYALRVFLNQFVSDEDMVFLRSSSDNQGEIKRVSRLEIYDKNTNKVKRYTPSTASRSYRTIERAIMDTTPQGEWLLDKDDIQIYCQIAGNLSFGRVERLPTPLTSLAKTEIYGGKFGVADAVGGVDTETMSEVLSMYCLAYRIVKNKLLTPGNDFNIGADLNNLIYPSVSKRCWIPTNTFSFKSKNDRESLVRFALKAAGGSKYTWLESCIAQSRIMMQKLSIKGNANIFSDKFFAKATSRFDPYVAYLKSGNTADPNKWNPADIWIFNSAGLSAMKKFNSSVQIVQASVITLNEFLVKQWNDGNIFPISLKKVNPSSPNFSLVNSNEYVERISIRDQNNPLVIEFDDNRSNRDVKINFILETVKLNPGMTAEKAQKNIFGNIGVVDPTYTKEIRLKFKVSTRGIDLEYQQTRGTKYSEAKGGAIGYQEYNKIISGTSQQGIKHLNTIKDNYDNTNLVLDKSVTRFTSHGLNLGPANMSLAAKYLDEIWTTINSDPHNASYLTNNRTYMKDKIIAGELGLSIHKITNKDVKRTVIQNLYNACASVGIGMGVDKNLLATVGAGLAQAQNIKFLGGIHGKVY